MWESLDRVDWARLKHAYGPARDVPAILRKMIAADEKTREVGWDAFWGVVNHQGDFYDSTVAAIPFLLEAIAHSGVPDRASILNYLRQRWLEAPQYGGDAALEYPPGGVDEPTPMRDEAAVAMAGEAPSDDVVQPNDEEAPSYRRMELCAWQVARAIQGARRTFEELCDDRNLEVAAASAETLLLWRETRRAGTKTLVRAIESETDSIQQAQRILELGVYGTPELAATLEEWTSPNYPDTTRAAAALACAWVLNPEPIPGSCAAALHETSASTCRAFARLPWVGVYHRGPWILPANAAALILRLSRNEDCELRWRAVQGLALGRETAKHLKLEQIVPVLCERLEDEYARVRVAAASALAERGEAALDVAPETLSVLLRALDDDEPGACGHAARLLAAAPHRLSPVERKAALKALDRAERRFAGKANCYVWFGSSGVQAAPFLKEQRAALAHPAEMTLPDLLGAYFWCDKAGGRLSPAECDRRLAHAYARDPESTIASAIAVIRAGSDRAASIGAALWLTTLGPEAEPALVALEAMAAGPLDSFAQEQARFASGFILRSLSGPPDNDHPELSHASTVSDLSSLLKHPDVCMRAGAAERLGRLPPNSPELFQALQSLEGMLADETSMEVGVAGEFECRGRLYHWRLERRQPRTAALRALFQLGHVPQDGRMLDAMLAASQQADVVCGRASRPPRFPIAQWQAAALAAGGPHYAETRIRAARQQCFRRAWSERGDGTAFACEAELAEMVRQISGRVV